MSTQCVMWAMLYTRCLPVACANLSPVHVHRAFQSVSQSVTMQRAIDEFNFLQSGDKISPLKVVSRWIRYAATTGATHASSLPLCMCDYVDVPLCRRVNVVVADSVHKNRKLILNTKITDPGDGILWCGTKRGYTQCCV